MKFLMKKFHQNCFPKRFSNAWICLSRIQGGIVTDYWTAAANGIASTAGNCVFASSGKPAA